MKVSFTPKEYRQLLELVHLGMWAVTAYQGEETAAARRYFDLDQQLLEMAASMGCADLIEKRAPVLEFLNYPEKSESLFRELYP